MELEPERERLRVSLPDAGGVAGSIGPFPAEKRTIVGEIGDEP